MMSNESSKVIRLYLIICGLFTLSASLIWGINTLFLLGAGLDIFRVFVVNAVYTASMAFFEIPTGVFADTLGRKMSFVSGTVVLILGTLAYAYVSVFENNFMYFIIASIVLGLAFTFYSGAVEAWVVDALKETGYEDAIDGVLANGNVVSSLSMLVGTVSGGIMATWDLRAPYVLRAVILMILAGLSILRMKDIGFERRALEIAKIPFEMKRIAVDSFKYGIKHKSVRKLMAVSFFFSSFMMWGWYAWQPYFLKLYGDEGAAWLAGIIAAMISLSMAAGSFLLPKILPVFKRRTRLLISAYSIQSAMIFVVGFSKSFYLAVAAFLVFAFSLGLAGPAKQAYLHQLIPSNQRATIISFDSLVGSSGSAIGQTGLGALSQEFSIASGYVVGGVLTMAMVPIMYALKQSGDNEDFLSIEENGNDN